ncbi:MAG: hypothetical protein AAGC92_04470 [Pseudomonadota bacterium]
MREVLSRPQTRRRLRVLGFVVLAIGAGWAFAALDLDLAALSLRPVLLNLLVLSPLNLLLAAMTLQLSAAALQRPMALRLATTRTAQAALAELLPLPGGAMVRGAALVEAGASAPAAASMVIATALLTLAMTLTGAGFALVVLGLPLGWALMLGAGLGLLLVVAGMTRRVAIRLIAAMVGLRILTITLSIVRLLASLAALGQTGTVVQALLYTVATTLGASVGIVPGGFGLNESLAAGLAQMIDASPAAAFMAVALNRCLDLVAAAALSALTGWRAS